MFPALLPTALFGRKTPLPLKPTRTAVYTKCQARATCTAVDKPDVWSIDFFFGHKVISRKQGLGDPAEHGWVWVYDFSLRRPFTDLSRFKISPHIHASDAHVHAM